MAKKRNKPVTLDKNDYLGDYQSSTEGVYRVFMDGPDLKCQRLGHEDDMPAYRIHADDVRKYLLSSSWVKISC